MSTKVTLRQKQISKGRKSLYLDYYPPVMNLKNGEPTRREFLGFYIFDDPKEASDVLHNEETLKIAKQIRQRRQNEIDKPEVYSRFEKEQLRIKELGDHDFIKYCTKISEKKTDTTWRKWKSTLIYLSDFTGGKLLFSDLTKKTVNDFKEYLLDVKSHRSDKSPLSKNSASIYFTCFRSMIRQALNDEYLQKDIYSDISSIKQTEVNRNFLTLEELNLLVKTECKIPLLKRAALFSALTGLRHSDIKKMIWNEVEFIEGNGYFLKFTQKKSGGAEMMPISEQAAELLGERKQPTDKVFEGLVYSAYWNSVLDNWVLKAGIPKTITFHCFRHTYATLQLSKGTEIYTVSKMLGHRDIKSTAVYAKVVDELKREAAGRITLNFDNQNNPVDENK